MRSPLIHKSLRGRFLLLLACVVNGIDALGILRLGGGFFSALSGNTVLLGITAI
ncbi:hypothetical protein [Methanomassiliicoccus luminyensis]|uniref:hypothetical protein n=1 Tax=Methanomassiliicoccus luminyensis TaxID=1080712 RepID=UPI00037B5B8C|nr:hypothetical protein [Methanomassiliicoccus luminyensis]